MFDFRMLTVPALTGFNCIALAICYTLVSFQSLLETIDLLRHKDWCAQTRFHSPLPQKQSLYHELGITILIF